MLVGVICPKYFHTFYLKLTMINIQINYKVIGSFVRWSGLQGLEEKYLYDIAIQMLLLEAH